MLEVALAIWGKVPPVARPTNPNLAAVLGLILGGIGLGVYFRNVLDCLVPIAIAVLLSVTIGDVGFWGGVVLAGIYGYLRSLESNERLAHPTTASGVPSP